MISEESKHHVLIVAIHESSLVQLLVECKRRQEREGVYLASVWIRSCGKAHQVFGDCCEFQIFWARLAASLEMGQTSFKEADVAARVYSSL